MAIHDITDAYDRKWKPFIIARQFGFAVWFLGHNNWTEDPKAARHFDSVAGADDAMRLMYPADRNLCEIIHA